MQLQKSRNGRESNSTTVNDCSIDPLCSTSNSKELIPATKEKQPAPQAPPKDNKRETYSQRPADSKVSALSEEIVDLLAKCTAKRLHANNRDRLASLRSSRKDLLPVNAKAFWRSNPAILHVDRETGERKIVH